MRRSAVCIFIFLFVSLAQAADVLPATQKELEPHQLTQLRSAIAYFLRPDSAPKSNFTLDNLNARSPILELLVKELVANLRDGRPIRAKRLEEAVTKLHSLAFKLSDFDREDARRRIAEDARDLLNLLPNEPALLRPVADVFEKLDLYPDGRNLEVFARLKTKAQLTDVAPALIQFLKRADEDGRAGVAKTMRKLIKKKKQRSLLNYVFLSMTGLMTEKELVKFFKHASIKFARVLEDPNAEGESFALDALEARRHTIVRDQIRWFARALSKEDIAVRSAFTKAVEEARDADVEGYDRESRLTFFRLFKDNRVKWDDRASWYRRAGELQDMALPVYKTLANDMELSHFALHHSCGEEAQGSGL